MESLSQLIALGSVIALLAAPVPHGGRYPIMPPPPRRPALPPRPVQPPSYTGPEDGMPRGGSTRPGPRTGGPGSPGSAGPTTPGAAAAPGASRGPSTPRGIALQTDYTTWNYWWEFNQHAFLQLKDAVYRGSETGSDDFFMGHGSLAGRDGGVRPTDADLHSLVLPALRAVLELPDQRDLTTSAMIALAKTRLGGADDFAAIRKRLCSDLPVLRETAALALGLTRRPEVCGDLIDLARDSAAGRRLCGQHEVDYRLRSFAVYALGLIGEAHDHLGLKTRIFEVVGPLIRDEQVRWDVKLSAVHALRLLKPGGPRSYRRDRLVYECVKVLWEYYRADLGRGENVVQSHVPTAIAGVLGRDAEQGDLYERAFASELGSETTKRALFAQSSALALAAMASPDDTEVCAALRRYYEKGKDHQARFFCLIALGRIGGDENRAALLGYLERGSKVLEKPWAALALGVLAFHRADADPGSAVDQTIGRALHGEFKAAKNDLSRGAYAVALGLARHAEAADDLMATLRRGKVRDSLAGYACLGLALMGQNRAVEEIRTLIGKGRNRPQLVVQGATALAVLGDKGAQAGLTAELAGRRPSLTLLAANAQALGLIGDRRSIDALVELAADDSRPRLARGYALVGLGGVADRDELPWHAPLAADMNYRAMLETLADGSAGVLDIL